MIRRFIAPLLVCGAVCGCAGSSEGRQSTASGTAVPALGTGTSSSAPAITTSSAATSVVVTTPPTSSSSTPTTIAGGPPISLASTLVLNGTSYTYCADADQDPDADGWGWTGSATCVVRNGRRDASGDGSAVPGPIDLAGVQVAENLVNPKATQGTLAVYRYLTSIYGKQILSGQQDLTWDDSIDMRQRVIDDTGRWPAMLGFDLMNYPYSPFTQDAGPGQQQIEEAIAQWERGGLVTICWHWRDPQGTSASFYAADTAFRIPMNGVELDRSSVAFTEIEADVDYIALQLKRLQDAGVPVLWRPLHEAAGGWFWWGGARSDATTAAEAQIALYRYMFDRLTNFHGLNNLIWVWNGQANSWYPGDAYVDIIGQDLYGEANDYGSKRVSFSRTLMYDTADKMIALTENGSIPDPERILDDNAWWLYFLTWNDGAGAAGETNENNFWTGEYHNSNVHKRYVFNHSLVVTLEELPVW